MPRACILLLLAILVVVDTAKGSSPDPRTSLDPTLAGFLDLVYSGDFLDFGSLEKALTNATSAFNISAGCRSNVERWIEDGSNYEVYALKMRDSWATRGGGMLEGNVLWTGRYWECVRSEPVQFTPKYCTTYFGLAYIPYLGGIPYDITFDSCFPDSCAEEEVRVLTSLTVGDVIKVPAVRTFCPRIDRSYDNFTIAIIVISAVVLLLAILGTAYHIFWVKKEEENKRNLFLCFSALRNGREILSTKKHPSNIGAINCVRVISTLWIVLGHALGQPLGLLDNMIPMADNLRGSFNLMPAFNGFYYACDSFFLITGILVTYLTLKQMRKNKGSFNIVKFYLQRYLRLTPLLAYCVIFTTGAYKFLGEGPFWQDKFVKRSQGCYEYWWTNLVYINNIYPENNSCFPHTWYLACDMQFYILTPLFLLALYKWPVLGVMKTVLMTLASIGVTWWISASNDKQPEVVETSLLFTVKAHFEPIFGGGGGGDSSNEVEKGSFMKETYDVPWCRIGAYLVGVLYGFVLYKTDRKIKLPKWAVVIGWVLAVGTGVAIVYGPFGASSEPRVMSTHVAAFYNALSRPAWAAAVGWVILASTCGYGGPVTVFLEWSLWLPLSRLTYAVYLIHLYVIYWYEAIQQRYIRYSHVWLVYSYSGHVIISFCLAMLACLLIEWPCHHLVRLLLSPAPNKRAAPPLEAEKRPPGFQGDDEKFRRGDNPAFALDEVSTKI